MLNNLKEALAVVRGANPNTIKEIDAAARHEQEDAAKEAKRLSEARARVEKAMPDRVQALIDDYVAREQAALRLAAESVACEQLEAQFGVTSWEAIRHYGVNPRIGSAKLDQMRKRLYASAPVPHDKQGRSGDQWQAAQARDASEALDGPGVERKIAERKHMLTEQGKRRLEASDRRATGNIARKKAAGIL